MAEEVCRVGSASELRIADCGLRIVTTLVCRMLVSLARSVHPRYTQSYAVKMGKSYVAKGCG